MKISDLTEEQIAAICNYEHVEGFEVVDEDGGWIDEGKYSYCTLIVQHEDKFYSFPLSRCGSHFTHYDYQYPSPKEIMEVEKQVVEVTKWVGKARC